MPRLTNYMFVIYNSSLAKPSTPSEAIQGSVKICETFRDCNYRPGLKAGIIAGGLFSGADGRKTLEQRSRYERRSGQGGFAGAILDPCSHQACDNINRFGYEKMVQTAAYILECLGRIDNLEGWLYPTGRLQARLPDDYFPNSDYF